MLAGKEPTGPEGQGNGRVEVGPTDAAKRINQGTHDRPKPQADSQMSHSPLAHLVDHDSSRSGKNQNEGANGFSQRFSLAGIDR